jgi:hypothetical protein
LKSVVFAQNKIDDMSICAMWRVKVQVAFTFRLELTYQLACLLAYMRSIENEEEKRLSHKPALLAEKHKFIFGREKKKTTGNTP